MDVFCDLAEIVARYEWCARDLQSLFVFHGLHCGHAEDFAAVVAKLEGSRAFRDDLSALTRQVRAQLQRRMTDEELLTLIALASGGEELIETGGSSLVVTRTAGLLRMFLAGVCAGIDAEETYTVTRELSLEQLPHAPIGNSLPPRESIDGFVADQQGVRASTDILGSPPGIFEPVVQATAFEGAGNASYRTQAASRPKFSFANDIAVPPSIDDASEEAIVPPLLSPALALEGGLKAAEGQENSSWREQDLWQPYGLAGDYITWSDQSEPAFVLASPMPDVGSKERGNQATNQTLPSWGRNVLGKLSPVSRDRFQSFRIWVIALFHGVSPSRAFPRSRPVLLSSSSILMLALLILLSSRKGMQKGTNRGLQRSSRSAMAGVARPSPAEHLSKPPIGGLQEPNASAGGSSFHTNELNHPDAVLALASAVPSPRIEPRALASEESRKQPSVVTAAKAPKVVESKAVEQLLKHADDNTRVGAKSNTIALVPPATMAKNLLSSRKPVYPTQALTQHLEGSVSLTAFIAKDGTVRRVDVLKGEPVFIDSAVAAASWRRYRPYLLRGAPVEVKTEITLNYPAR